LKKELDLIICSYGDDEERAKESVASSQKENIVGRVSRSFGKEISIVGKRDLDPMKYGSDIVKFWEDNGRDNTIKDL